MAPNAREIELRDRAVLRLLLVSSVLTFALLGYAAYDENFGADWHDHQSDYKRALIARAGTERERRLAERFEVHPKQIYLPDLHSIDRCVTCHVAVDDPQMADAPQPLSAHSGDIMQNHPKETFGCVVCHSGQGRATIAEEAHGHVPHWPAPMLPLEQLDRACGKCHTQESLPGVPRYNEAMALVKEKSCLFCHKLRGQGGDKGPDITSAGANNDAEWHFRHFKDPRSVVATSEMPNLELSDEQAEALTFLMMCLQGESIPTELLSNPRPAPLEAVVAGAVDPLGMKGHVGSKTCIGCHQNLHPEAVGGWHDSKMASTFERIRDEPLRDNCLPCHTTGYNPETGHYSEEGVACEACHGPGQEPVGLVLEGRVDEHKKRIRVGVDSKLVCARCHNPHVPVGTHADFYRQLPARF